MLAFKKYILPFQQEEDVLAFNIRPLDTIIYNKSNFREKADHAIDQAILKAATTIRPSQSLPSYEHVGKYLSVEGLRLTPLNTEEANALYRICQPLGFLLLDGSYILYLGLFDTIPAKEVVFRLKLLIQSLHNEKQIYKSQLNRMKLEQIEKINMLWEKIRIEVLVSSEIHKAKIENRVEELTKNFESRPWRLINNDDIKKRIEQEYETIGEI